MAHDCEQDGGVRPDRADSGGGGDGVERAAIGGQAGGHAPAPYLPADRLGSSWYPDPAAFHGYPPWDPRCLH